MATKKTTSKKAPTKKKTTVSKARKSSKPTGIRQYVNLQPETRPFMSFEITKQTFYWLVFGLVAIIFTLWLMQLQMDIQSLYDKVDQSISRVSE